MTGSNSYWYKSFYQLLIYLFCGFVGYGEKQCSSAFWNGELESELREQGNLDFFGLLKENDSREGYGRGGQETWQVCLQSFRR